VTDDQLFDDFCREVLRKARQLGVYVTTVDIGYYIRWGPQQWLHRFDPARGRREGNDLQVNEAIEKIRACR
jgi:hypothetical protein